jgi:hypothetical protein
MPWRSAAAMFAGAPGGGGLLEDALDAEDAGGLFFGLSPRGLSAGASDWGTAPRLPGGDAAAAPRAGGDAAGVKPARRPATKTTKAGAAVAPPRHADQAGLRCLDGSHDGACVRCAGVREILRVRRAAPLSAQQPQWHCSRFAPLLTRRPASARRLPRAPAQLHGAAGLG